MRVVTKKINDPTCDYFNEGEIYHAANVSRYAFTITDDEGNALRCLFKNCVHIDGDWTIIGNPAVVEVKS